jgi:uncharacterized protein (TIGR00255 family)
MINSMTAFARERGEYDRGTLVVEIRSVNHRYLDCSFKLPEQLRALEPRWREQLQSSLSRGKVECMLRWQPNAAANTSLVIDENQLGLVVAAANQVQKLTENCQAINPLELLQWPGVLTSGDSAEDELPALAAEVFTRALANLVDSRSREGSRLAGFIDDRLQQVAREVTATRKLMPQLLASQRTRIEQKLAELEVEADPQRLEQELVFLAQKADVEEELDRLGAHVEEVRRALDKGGPCGRRLDFLMQELNREANTLSSKSISSSTTKKSVELKVLIEQMREQIQNLE